MYSSNMIHNSNMFNNSNILHNSNIYNSSTINTNPEVNDIIRRHEEIANNMSTKVKSSSRLPSQNRIPSHSHIQDDEEVETIITTTTMKVTPNVGRSTYIPQTYARENHFLSSTPASNLQYSSYSNTNASPLPRNDIYNQPHSNSYLNVGSSSNIRSSSQLGSRVTYQPPSNLSHPLYPASRGASQKRVTEVVTHTYENQAPSAPLANILSNSRVNLGQSCYSNNGTQNRIPSLAKIPDPQEEENDNDFVRRIYVKGDGFEYEEIIDDEDPQNNYKQLRDAYHDEWQRIDYTPDFVLPFLEIQQQTKNAQTSMSQLNSSQISGIGNRDLARPGQYSRNNLDSSSYVPHPYLKDVPVYKSYIA